MGVKLPPRRRRSAARGGRSLSPAEDEDYESKESPVEQHRHCDGGIATVIRTR